jgi:hypothetical protein
MYSCWRGGGISFYGDKKIQSQNKVWKWASKWWLFINLNSSNKKNYKFWSLQTISNLNARVLTEHIAIECHFIEENVIYINQYRSQAWSIRFFLHCYEDNGKPGKQTNNIKRVMLASVLRPLVKGVKNSNFTLETMISELLKRLIHHFPIEHRYICFLYQCPKGTP